MKTTRRKTLLQPISADFETAVKAMLGTPLPQNPDKVRGSRAVNFRKPTRKRAKKGAKKR
jgi:hypothetical protein